MKYLPIAVFVLVVMVLDAGQSFTIYQLMEASRILTITVKDYYYRIQNK